MSEGPRRLPSPPSASALAWVCEKVGAAGIIASEPLIGGISHSNHAITLDLPDRRRVVLRRWVPGWQDQDPDFTVEREAAALTLLERASFAAPRLIAADSRGERCEAPALLMSYLSGRHPIRSSIPSARFLEQLATTALSLHRISEPWPGIPRYRPYNELRDPRPPERTRCPDLWHQAFTRAANTRPADREVFIHRDYHPGNTLWLRGRLTGVVDWTTASRGPAGVDLGHMRWNLVLSHGEQVAGEFLRKYCALHGERFDHDPYWDLRTLVDLLPDDGLTDGDLARLEPYLRRVLAQC